MSKVPCKRCNGLILVATAKKYQGYSNYCLKMHNQEQVKVIEVKKEKEKSIIDLAIESEQLLYNLEKQHKEELALERIFTEKKDNKANVLQVLDSLCFNMTGQSLQQFVSIEA